MGEELSLYYTLLRNPYRRRIVEILGKDGRVSFKDLKEKLDLSVGAIYYHLDMLTDFVTQDEDRKYLLSDRGLLLHKLLGEQRLPATDDVKMRFGDYLGRWVFLAPIFLKTMYSRKLSPIRFSIVFAGALGAGLAKVEPLLFFFNPSTLSFEVIFTLFLLDWISIFGLAELFAYLFYRRLGGELDLLAGVGISMLPLSLFPYFYMAVPLSVARVALLILQVWCLLLLTSALSFGKGLRFDRSIAVSLTILYVNVAILTLFGRI